MDQTPTDSRYTVLHRLASGGMADVYLAVLNGAQGFKKQTIVKRIREGLTDNEDYRRMFVEEARLMASLTHGNIVSVLDFGEGQSGFYIALEFVDGLDLGKLLRRVGRLAPPMAIYLCGCVLQALAYVHARGDAKGRPLHIVHRDVSPSNVFLGRNGDVKLGDFGVAKVAGAPVQTLPGTVKGKLAYMSPEQAAAQEVDGRADLYAVGVVVFEALLGRRPEEDPAIHRQILDGDLARLQAVEPGLTPALVEFLRRALAPELEARFQSAEEMARALAACAAAPLPGPTDVARLVEANFTPVEPKRGADPFAAVLGLQSKTEPGQTVPERPASTKNRPPLAASVIVGVIAAAAVVLAVWGVSGSAAPPPAVVAVPVPVAAPVAAPPSAPPEPIAPTDPSSPSPVIAAAPTKGRPQKTGKGTKALLTVNSTPWAKVFVDGAYQGDTPVRGLAVEPGRRRLRLVNPQTNLTFETTLDLAPGEQRTLPIDLAAGKAAGLR